MTKSSYGDRETVGTLALEASKCKTVPVVGDMAHELMPSLVDDLNEALQSDPFNGQIFYVTIHEKKDAQLTNMLLRRVIKTPYRPYPELATSVFKMNPKNQEVQFCWSLPHWSSFPNIFNNPNKVSKEQLKDIVAYTMSRLDHFGFRKVGENEDKTPVYIPIENFQDRKLGKDRTKIHFKT